MIADGLVAARVDAASPDALDLMQALDNDLRDRYPGVVVNGLRPDDAARPRFIFVVARIDGRPVGCGAVRELDPLVGEIKRMFVRPGHRGRGIARRVLSALEAHAAALGYTTLRLETGDRQPEALGLYKSAGYRAIIPFGEYVGNPFSRCFEKRLA
jgi:GNAT superfamily N-acetyltransferase